MIIMPPYPKAESVGELARRNRIQVNNPSAWREFLQSVNDLAASGKITFIVGGIGGWLVPTFRRAQP